MQLQEPPVLPASHEPLSATTEEAQEAPSSEGAENRVARNSVSCANACCKIPLTKGQFALVDAEDYDKVVAFRWHVCGGYAALGHTGIRMHHFVLGYSKIPRGFHVHHRDENPLNNRKDNLELLSVSKHNVTRRRLSNNTSGYKGVSWWPKGKGRWRVQIAFNKRKIHVGNFTNKRTAARAYDRAARQLFGEVAKLNFPRQRS